MKALVHTKPYSMEYKDVSEPILKKDDVLIKVASVGICGSDVHGYTGNTGRRIPPIIMGHEASGEIAKVGENSTFNIGDRVTFDSTIHCGTCKYCKRKQVNLCSERKVLGVSCDEYLQHGAMAEYLSIPERIVHKIDKNIDFDDAALIEPASVAYHAVRLSKFKPHDKVIVIGTGVIGLTIIQALKIKGCNKIISVDLVEERLNVAKYYGADITINSKNESEMNYFKKNFSGEIDLAFEAVGINETINLGINCVRKKGKVILVGNIAQNVNVPLQNIVTRELKLLGSCAIAGEYPIVIKHLSEKKLKFDKINTAKVPLSEGSNYFEKLEQRNSDHIKVILNP